ncbi:MAG: tRNA (adenosine(37)-N6)-threonylcarbamoyltransferase complex transferase subunit TsaD [Clostridia bacterium]|nr:tRNA (adenosine(37)-N6)-threonylcarbamoyltransferase complex transferase subunit TsaD [Clostridia bacterium]
MTYLEKSKEKLNSLRNRNGYLILAFESSCDETAVAVTRGREVLSSVISSQIEIHKRFGGVVPEIASRNHALAIDSITKEALEKAGVTFDDIDAIAVTYGAGLLGALLVGVSYAKALAYTLEKPLIACNHIKGHIAANYISAPDLEPPFICLLASGGHTYILKVNAFDDMEVMGETQDDAVGEAFDKVARVLGLPYPGGPEIDKLARLGKPSYKLPRAFKGEKHLNFSYSGLKTAVINLVANTKARGGEIIPEDLACSFQTEATGVLIENTIEAARRSNISTICLAGGVGANSALRDGLTKAGQKAHCKVLLPPRSLCTDNAAMIGICAYEEIKCGIEPAELSLDANPGL